ncbi:hypothetical protein BSUW23_18225 [Bacillus spizizenii str. W23]|uniref:Uncharacterized protein n=1 Tax=Bacillus spizizenii (strain ATCC 23059 / NRRL B-14472 / W23) TaxID=655816 RepID=E0TUR0_BACSH|nr:hypothetical protein BSUW23_18225 [Bacillus spizizenii str. W23]EFG92323.1 hypothetical protein BSU6633_09516 [Bacillus spizizenii ATCC 6633 = JCM 2499]
MKSTSYGVNERADRLRVQHSGRSRITHAGRKSR